MFLAYLPFLLRLSLSGFVQYLGSWFVFSYLILIWCADSFAYFGGRHFGGKKLAPAISPGKTQSGAIYLLWPQFFGY